MTIEELKAAYAGGAKIQIDIGRLFTPVWIDIENPKFNGVSADAYRIKPTEEK